MYWDAILSKVKVAKAIFISFKTSLILLKNINITKFSGMYDVIKLNVKLTWLDLFINSVTR